MHENKPQSSFKMTVGSVTVNDMGPLEIIQDSWHFYNHLKIGQYNNLTKIYNLVRFHVFKCYTNSLRTIVMNLYPTLHKLSKL